MEQERIEEATQGYLQNFAQYELIDQKQVFKISLMSNPSEICASLLSDLPKDSSDATDSFLFLDEAHYPLTNEKWLTESIKFKSFWLMNQKKKKS